MIVNLIEFIENIANTSIDVIHSKNEKEPIKRICKCHGNSLCSCNDTDSPCNGSDDNNNNNNN